MNYLPELQGLTELQQQNLRNIFRTQASQLQRTAARSPFQSSGAYLGAMAQLRGQEGLGLSQIEIENMLKNALLSREERLMKEAREWQKQFAEWQMNKQLEMMQKQQEMAQSNMLLGALGSFLGNIGTSAFNWLGQNLGLGLNPIQKIMYQYMQNPEFQKSFQNYIQQNPQTIFSPLGMGQYGGY